MSTWYQETLMAPEVLELNIRIGVIPETDHAQALVELKDPTTGVLLAQASAPHTRADNYRHLLDWAAATARELLDAAVEPF